MEIRLLPEQVKVMGSPAKYKLASGGVGGGKTWIGSLWALQQISQYPFALGCIIANTYGQLARSTIKPFCEMLDSVGVQWRFGCRPPWSTNHTFVNWSSILTVANGACIVTQSAERESVILGQELGWIWLDETRDTSLLMWQNANGRLRDNLGSLSVLITTTPAGRQHWLYETFFEKPLPNSATFCLRTRDNIHLPKDYADGVEAVVGKTLAQQELEGMWINSQLGQCYEFDRVKHIKPQALNPKLPLILSADMNVEPFCSVVLQVDRAKRTVNVLDEIVIENNGSTRQCAEEFIRRYGSWTGEVWFWTDMSSDKRDTREGRFDSEIMMTTLRQRFDRVRDAHDRRQRYVFDGVMSVNALLNPLQGEPRLLVDPKARSLIRDFESLCWDPGTRKIDKSDPKRSHSADCVRYVCVQEFPIMSKGTLSSMRELEVSRYID